MNKMIIDMVNAIKNSVVEILFAVGIVLLILSLNYF
jgi:hypothetical protein